MSYGVFKTTIDTLAQSTVPTGPLDRRVLDYLSGADYGALMSGLRFLGLVDDSKKATKAYRELVQAAKDGGENFQTALSDIVFAAYLPITGNLDLDHGTISQLEKAFKDAGVAQGQMLTKTIRFYLKAITDCGVTISPYITKAKAQRTATAKKNGNEKRSRLKKKAKADDHSDNVRESIPSGFERLPLPGMPDAFIQYPVDVTDAQCSLFEALIGVLRTHAKARTTRKEKP